MPVLSAVLDSKVCILDECGYVGLWSTKNSQKYIRKVFLHYYNICNYLFMLATVNL